MLRVTHKNVTGDFCEDNFCTACYEKKDSGVGYQFPFKNSVDT